jgi:hypothetical protein
MRQQLDMIAPLQRQLREHLDELASLRKHREALIEEAKEAREGPKVLSVYLLY